MYHRTYPITPSQQAVNGAFDTFVEGHRKGDPKQMLVGLTVVQSATEAQAKAALLYVQGRQHISADALAAILAS